MLSNGGPMLINRAKPVADKCELGYPRLVMGNHEKLNTQKKIPNVTRSVSKLWRYVIRKDSAVPGSNFRERLCRLAEMIGVNDPSGTRDDMGSWLSLVFEARFWTYLFHRLKPSDIHGEIRLDQGFWDQCYEDWRTQRRPPYSNYPDSPPRENAWMTDQISFSGVAAGEFQRLEWLGIASPEELRFLLADEWFSKFIARVNGQSDVQAALSFPGTPVVSISRDGRLLARCGAGTWAIFERASLYGARDLKKCGNENCRKLFKPDENHYKYCSDECEGATNKRRWREKIVMLAVTHP